MKHEQKIEWMKEWCKKNGATLELETTCGFGRECVGIVVDNQFPDYDEDLVWHPDDAYHKHPCVAVLGRGEDAESQLYEWLKWFDNHGFYIEASDTDDYEIRRFLGTKHVSMVKKSI